MKRKKWWILLVILAVGLAASGCATNPSDPIPKATRGQLDLSQMDLYTSDPIPLDGHWELYWDRFVSQEQLRQEQPDMIVEVPNVWNDYKLEGLPLPGVGIATYRLHLKTALPAGSLLGMRLYTFSSAYRLFVDGKQVASNGTISRLAEDEVGEYRPQAVYFSVPASEFDLLIQVSNHHYARGGFWYSAFIGSPESIEDYHTQTMLKEALVIGALLIVSLFYLSTYFLMRKQRYSLYFGLFCLALIFAYDTAGQFLITKVLPSLCFDAVIFFWYSSTYWVLFFMTLYANELFETRATKIIATIIAAVSGVGQLIYLVIPALVYTQYGRIGNWVDLVGYLSILAIAMIGVRRKKPGAWLNLISIGIITGTYLHDVLYWTYVLRGIRGEALYIGIFGFLLLEMIIQSKRIKQYVDNKVQAEMSFLHTQIKHHFLHNALNTIISISRTNTERARELLVEYSSYLRGSIDFRDSGQDIPLKSEIDHVMSYIEIEKARFEERLEVNFQLPESLYYTVPIYTLQPIIKIQLCTVCWLNRKGAVWRLQSK